MSRLTSFTIIFTISLFFLGCSNEKTADERAKSCQISIKLVQENSVCEAVLDVAFEYNKTGDTISCSDKDWSGMGLPFYIRKNSEKYEKLKDVWLKDCNKEDIEKYLPLNVENMKYIFDHKICNKAAKKDFLECRQNLIF